MISQARLTSVGVSKAKVAGEILDTRRRYVDSSIPNVGTRLERNLGTHTLDPFRPPQHGPNVDRNRRLWFDLRVAPRLQSRLLSLVGVLKMGTNRLPLFHKK